MFEAVFEKECALGIGYLIGKSIYTGPMLKLSSNKG